MIDPIWRRICGIHVTEKGQVAVVWIAHDKEADRIHLYDCYKHEREVIAVQAETLKRREGAKWIPIAWRIEDKEVADMLLEHGCNMLPENDIEKDSDPIAETVSLDIWERMRTGRFKVAKHLESWLDEYKTFQRQDSKVPRESYPLMSATRHAVRLLNYARAKPKKSKINSPRLAIV